MLYKKNLTLLGLRVRIFRDTEGQPYDIIFEQIYN